MGVLIHLPEGRVEESDQPGVRVESAESQTPSLVRSLALNPHSPLYPSVNGRISWPKREPRSVALLPGVFVVETFWVRAANQFRYLAVDHASVKWISEAEALTRLGALEELKGLGLEDAAVALTMGDLDAARVQWLRWKDGEP